MAIEWTAQDFVQEGLALAESPADLPGGELRRLNVILANIGAHVAKISGSLGTIEKRLLEEDAADGSHFHMDAGS